MLSDNRTWRDGERAVFPRNGDSGRSSAAASMKVACRPIGTFLHEACHKTEQVALVQRLGIEELRNGAFGTQHRPRRDH